MLDLLKSKLTGFIDSFSKETEKKLEVNLSLESKVKGLIFDEIEIQEKDVDDLLYNMELSLLEADVSLEVSSYLINSIKQKVIGKKIKKSELQGAIKQIISDSLLETMPTPPDLLELIRTKEKPVKVLFLGPNGAGKTTTIAKLASLLKSKGIGSVISASDTFRAAAIEQTVFHAEKLGVKVIKHDYGSDPAAVAFDASNYAKAHGIDVVLIDTAGRQETNVNLLDEMRKINRVVKPDIKIFVGESIAGNALVEQLRAFHQALGLDGVILTKLDCDAKGGVVLSIGKIIGLPILFIGNGQVYDKLKVFEPRELIVSLVT